MPALAAPLLLIQAAPSPPVAAVSPAIRAYRETCIEGSFLEGPLPDKDISPRWISDMYEPIWTVNHPELGYSKQFRHREDGSTVLEIGMYPTSAAQINAGTTKQ